MKTFLILLVSAVLCCATAVANSHGPQPQQDPFQGRLFPPELIMRHGDSIGITESQRQSLTQTMRNFQAAVIELQWALQDEQMALVKQLSGDDVDEEATLRQLAQVIEAESKIKKEHFRTLIRLRNLLSAQQRETLRAHNQPQAR